MVLAQRLEVSVIVEVALQVRLKFGCVAVRLINRQLSRLELFALHTVPICRAACLAGILDPRPRAYSFLLSSLQSTESTDSFFQQWATAYDVSDLPSAGTSEYDSLRLVFQANLQKILSINQNASTRSFWAAPNAFTHLTAEEFAKKYLGKVPGDAGSPSGNIDTSTMPPSAVNWVELGMVTPVKDQKVSGCSHWHFTIFWC